MGVIRLEKRIELPLELLDSRPTQFIQELRSAVAAVRRDEPLCKEAELQDIGFRRGQEGIVVTLYFSNTVH